MTKPPVHRTMEILLVEDTLADAKLAIEALREGHIRSRVTLVRDGEEALRFLRRETIFARAPRPDLILLDLNLPKLHGREVLAALRDDRQWREIPVIVLTASAVHRELLQQENLPVEAYMVKPIDWEQFVCAVKSLRRCWFTQLVLSAAG